jgi:cytoskeletal protein CcmA (bactofilin family)
MFGKDGDKLKSFLGSQSQLKGELSSTGILRLEGAVVGTIKADQVLLTETAVIKGDIIARKIIVGGQVEGNLIAEDLVEIRSKGKVMGRIFTSRFLVMSGGEFNGQITMQPEGQKVVAFESRERKGSRQ